MKQILNSFQSFTTLCYKVVIPFMFILLLASCSLFNSAIIPNVDCDEIKQCQYSVQTIHYKLILVETNKVVMFIPEDSDVWKSNNMDCCIRYKSDTIPVSCITCNDFVAFVNSQLTNCSISY